MPNIDIMDIPEKQIFGYIDTPFLPNIQQMLSSIFFYDYEKFEPVKQKGWTHEIIKDVLAEIQTKAFFTVAFSVAPDLSVRALDCELSRDSSIFSKFINKEPWLKLSNYQKQRISEFIPDCHSAVLVKHASHIVIATKFSLRRFLRYSQRIPKSKYLELNPDPFMRTLVDKGVNEEKPYDYRLRATASWGNDTTLHYYGADSFSSDILHYDSSEHTNVMYVASAHRAAVNNAIFCAYYPKEES